MATTTVSEMARTAILKSDNTGLPVTLPYSRDLADILFDLAIWVTDGRTTYQGSTWTIKLEAGQTRMASRK